MNGITKIDRVSKRVVLFFIFLLTAGAVLMFVPTSASAATLYWVGGNGDNVGTNANDWSTSDPASCADGAGNDKELPNFV